MWVPNLSVTSVLGLGQPSSYLSTAENSLDFVCSLLIYKCSTISNNPSEASHSLMKCLKLFLSFEATDI